MVSYSLTKNEIDEFLRPLFEKCSNEGFCDNFSIAIKVFNSEQAMNSNNFNTMNEVYENQNYSGVDPNDDLLLYSVFKSFSLQNNYEAEPDPDSNLCNGVGDLNGDGGYNVLDVVKMANLGLLGSSTVIYQQMLSEGVNPCRADLNGDGGYNVLDIVGLVNCVLSQSCGDLEVEAYTWITGCTDSDAINYNPLAEIDDNGCLYDELGGGS